MRDAFCCRIQLRASLFQLCKHTRHTKHIAHLRQSPQNVTQELETLFATSHNNPQRANDTQPLMHTSNRCAGLAPNPGPIIRTCAHGSSAFAGCVWDALLYEAKTTLQTRPNHKLKTSGKSRKVHEDATRDLRLTSSYNVIVIVWSSVLRVSHSASNVCECICSSQRFTKDRQIRVLVEFVCRLFA